MKKLLTLLMMVLLCLPGMPALAEESEREIFTSGDFEYALLEDGTAEITKYRGKAEKLDVPGELDGHSVTAIGYRAFCFCNSLTEITLPDSLVSIGDEAFSFCGSLTGIVLPDSLTSVGVNPFSWCDQFTSIRVSPDHPSLMTIDGVLFSKTDKRLITYPCAFKGSSYAVPQGIKIIGDSAFSPCRSLSRITLPDSLVFIDDEAFLGCYSLTAIALPDSVTSVGTNPFCFCYDLTDFHVSPDHPTLATIDGVLFSKTDKSLIAYPCAFRETSYAVPQGTEIIGDSAFFNCSSLTDIILPDSLVSIGDGAFFGCSGLSRIALPDGLVSIADKAFYGCNSLSEVALPDGLVSIGDEAFRECDSLREIVVGRDSYAKKYCKEHDLPYTYAAPNEMQRNATETNVAA